MSKQTFSSSTRGEMTELPRMWPFGIKRNLIGHGQDARDQFELAQQFNQGCLANISFSNLLTFGKAVFAVIELG